jgi:pimeloyl-ACP methyl ester carboxylesterase
MNDRGSLEDTLEDAVPWARRYRPYAVLAARAYRNESSNNLTINAEWTCEESITSDRTGLYYDVWDNRSTRESVIAFRGTDGAKDWWSNARFVTKYLPVGLDQYNVVRREITGVVVRALRRMPDATFITTGHSLGGGLAQQAAYAHPNIKRVLAFDSSPLTGFLSVPKEERDRNRRGIRIERVYEKGEILAYARGFFRRYVPLDDADPSIIEVRFNFAKGLLPIRQHSMVALAMGMEKLVNGA